MSVRELEDCLLVALDFEGLCSLERTEQEDILLSVLNAAFSNLTLFKTEFRIDRDTEKMFSRFQEGISYIKGDGRLFQGRFTIVAKDVPERDIEALESEFQEKLSSIVSNDSANNFLTRMFCGQYATIMSNPLGTPGYNESLVEAFDLLMDQKPQFETEGVSSHCSR
ncbi:e3 ubiquitin-protein ligase trip12 [Pelomyxa schiedti]|nr:e3 ubiquitin-protein ligase trip12 [Pelomyxa schiedti]